MDGAAHIQQGDILWRGADNCTCDRNFLRNLINFERSYLNSSRIHLFGKGLVGLISCGRFLPLSPLGRCYL